jgi:hypothetical protein
VGGDWLSVASAGRMDSGMGDFVALVSWAAVGLAGMVNCEYWRVRVRIQAGVC